MDAEKYMRKVEEHLKDVVKGTEISITLTKKDACDIASSMCYNYVIRCDIIGDITGCLDIPVFCEYDEDEATVGGLYVIERILEESKEVEFFNKDLINEEIKAYNLCKSIEWKYTNFRVIV